MIKRVVFFSLILSFTLSTELVSQNAKLVFYQTNTNRTIFTDIYVNKEKVIGLRFNSYFEYEVPAGNYEIGVSTLPNSISINAEAGKTYYIRPLLTNTFFQGLQEIIVVNEITALQQINAPEMRKLESKDAILPRNKQRIGAILSPNGNLGDKYPVFANLDDDKFQHRFGEYVFLGLNYGFEVTNWLDLGVSASLLFSGNNRKTEIGNQVAGHFSLTPSYIIALEGNGEENRLKIGAGVDYLMFNRYIIDHSPIHLPLAGEDRTIWNYKNTLGYHGHITWETNMTQNWLFSFGLRASYFELEYESSDTSLQPIESFKNPNAISIGVLFGIFYHF